VHEVLAFAGSRIVAAGIPSSQRPDLARRWEVASDDLGYSLALPRALVERSVSRISVFGVGDGVATRMQPYCTPTVRRVFGC
jgi:hypothetical protein